MSISRVAGRHGAGAQPRMGAAAAAPFEERLARALGWFGVGLGTAEIAAPGALGGLAGLTDGRRMLRAFGLREIASGAGILSQPAASWLWARVAGDVLDLGVLGGAVAATAAVAGVTALDVMCALRLRRRTHAFVATLLGKEPRQQIQEDLRAS